MVKIHFIIICLCSFALVGKPAGTFVFIEFRFVYHRHDGELSVVVYPRTRLVSLLDATFEQETAEGLVLIDFWATWCGPCLMQAPILEQLSEEISEDELKIVKIDVDENPETAQKFGIMSIPTLLFKKDGEVVKQVAGVHTKEQIKAIVAELS